MLFAVDAHGRLDEGPALFHPAVGERLSGCHRERPQAVYWFDPVFERRRALFFYDDWSSVAFGSEALSYTLLPPGRQVLEIVAPGFEPRIVEVDICAGAINPVRVALEH